MHARPVPRFRLALACLAVCATALPAAAQRFTVCLFRFHEPDEQGVVRRWLSSPDFEIVDLTDALLPAQTAHAARVEREGDPGSSWVTDLCRPDLRCDVVVHSGEFAGRFFGGAGASLSLQEMEEAACASPCAGLFHAPREVFLLGCNTLATKDQDRRTPEEYLQVLLDHGFDRPAAERAVELRYGPLGPSFREAVRRIFAGVPRIYGFRSVAPRGEYSAPRLERYFRTKGDYARWLEAAGRSEAPNRHLLSAFAGTDLVQVSGLQPWEAAAADRDRICALYDERRSLSERMRIVRDLMAREDVLAFVPTVEIFFNRHPAQLLDGEARRLFLAVQANTAARDRLLGLVHALGASASTLELAHLAHHLGWLSDERFRALALDVTRRVLARPLSSEAVDITCEVAKHQPIGEAIRLEDFPPGTFEVAEGLRMVDCLRSRDSRVTDRLLAVPRESPDPSTRQWAVFALSHRLPLTEPQLLRLAELLTDHQPEVRDRVAWMFRMQHPLPPRVAAAVARRDPALAARLAALDPLPRGARRPVTARQ